MAAGKLFKSLTKQRIPLLEWAPKYNFATLTSDLIAGITVGLTVIPQALAYATLAGLEPQYGLYSAFMGCFVYVIFGSCKDITIGPTALMALMTYQQIAGRNVDFAILLCFLTGVVQLIMALLHLGVLIDFISIPVSVGFTSATSVIIVTSQLKNLLGIKLESSGFLDTVTKVFGNLYMANYCDCILGVACIVILLILRRLGRCKRGGHTLWLVSTARNALIVLISSLMAYFWSWQDHSAPFSLTGQVQGGLPPFGLPPFSTELSGRNQTLGPLDMLSDLGAAIVLVPAIGVLGNVAIAKAFSGGLPVDATQELLALALANVLGSCVGSMPVTGSFSRSAVNHASGARTPLAGLFTGGAVLLALAVLTPAFAYIPKAALAAVIFSAVIFMIELEVIRPMWRSSRKDLIPAAATFIFCLLIGVEYGILVGVGINVVFLLYPSARPEIRVEKLKTVSGQEYIVITPGNSLYFPAVDFIKTSVAKVSSSCKNVPVVIDCRHILGADFTAGKGIYALTTEFSLRKQPLFFVNTRKEVVSVFQGVSDTDFVHFESMMDVHLALDKCKDHWEGGPLLIGQELREIRSENVDKPHKTNESQEQLENGR